MRKTALLAIACAFGIGAAAWLAAHPEPTPEVTEERLDHVAEYSTPVSEQSHAQPAHQVASNKAVQSRNPVPTSPDAQRIRDEIEADPHRTPHALTEYARAMAPQMESALASSASAQQLTSTLVACALSQDAPQALRAFCLTNLDRLAKKHGGRIAKTAKKVRSQVPKRVALLAISI